MLRPLKLQEKKEVMEENGCKERMSLPDFSAPGSLPSETRRKKNQGIMRPKGNIINGRFGPGEPGSGTNHPARD